ncbi:hypothetical protein HYC85_017051 [Camellia sinensis]|uniref:Uncharacterized protein n=1 Tax=Camellia sinensis TaxID=4442 RepID=A0A7J7H1E4_CAMSI|nr:hypothetical protein HYC85_017051 [Camellia sinensis]
MESICLFFFRHVESGDSKLCHSRIRTSTVREEGEVIKSVNSFGFPVRNNRDISVLVGTGNIIWSGIYVMVSRIGIVLPVGLLHIFYINPFDIAYWWYKGLLFVACMFASPIVFGGVVVGLNFNKGGI